MNNMLTNVANALVLGGELGFLRQQALQYSLCHDALMDAPNP